MSSTPTPVPDIPITDLDQVVLQANVQPGGNDTVTLYWGSEAWSNSVPDSMLDISAVWNKVEFNVLGDTGGSRADFNEGSSIMVGVALDDGSSAPPTCLGPTGTGTTGETNNLNLGSCKAGVGAVGPFIRFTESN